MQGKDYLSLRLVRLKHGEEWTTGHTDEFGQFSFVFLKGGDGEFSFSGPASPFNSGDVLIASPNQPARVGSRNGSELTFWWFSSSLEHLFPLFASDEICLIEEVVDALKAGKHFDASTPIAAECHRLLADVPPLFNLDHRSHLIRLVATVLSGEFKNVRSRRTGFVTMDEHIAQIFEQLSVHEILNLSVGELANRFSCSRRHLNRLFHQYFGFSVAALRMEMRLLKAVALLRDPNAKIIHIADQCGFNHLGLFNSCFRRRFGASPGEWRKREPEAAKNSHTPRSEDNCRLRMIGLCPWSAEAAGAKPQLDEIEKPPRRGAKSAKAGEGPAPAPNRRLPLGRGNGDGQLRIQVRP